MRINQRDLTGQVFGRLTAIKKVGYPTPNAVWECSCICGKLYEVKAHSLVCGNTKSCGCLPRGPKPTTAGSAEERRRVSAREFRLRRNGWTLAAVEAAVLSQNNKCAICGCDMSSPFADHRHGNPPKRRELLCNPCNVGIGFFKENPETMEKAAAYVRRHNATC